jgi:hypothetical protein
MNKENINPDFDKWLKENNPRKHLKVPEGYFDAFPDQIMNHLKAETSAIQHEPKIKQLFSRKWVLRIAASLIVLISAISIFQQISNTNTMEFANLEEDQTWDYVMAYSTDYEINEIAAFAEMDETITEWESEIFTNNISDQYLDEIDIELVEDFYK